MSGLKKDSHPLKSHLNNFLDWLEIEKGLSPKTQENYARFLKKFFDWLKINRLENLRPHELTLEHIRKYRIFLSRQCLSLKRLPLKKTTQNYYLIALRSFLSYFLEHDILSLPPEKIKLAKEKTERQIKFLTLEQIEKLFSVPNTSTVQGLRDRTILEILFSTGMRIGELVNLNRDQFKITPKTKDLEITIIGKGGRVRPVYFSERAIFWLKKYLNTRQDNEKALFINYRGKKDAAKRLSARSIEKNIKKYSLMAGLPFNITPHVIRHSFATDLLSQGVDLRTIQEFLGHKNIAATQIYTHVTNKQLREIHRKFHGGKNLTI
jgi:site-specific recombinase XerD